MKTIRLNCFETNSSSSHSLCIKARNGLRDSYLTVDDIDNHVHVEFGEFGWGYEKTSDQYDKLSYLITMVVETESNDCKSIQDLYKTEGFNSINEILHNKNKLNWCANYTNFEISNKKIIELLLSTICI